MFLEVIMFLFKHIKNAIVLSVLLIKTANAVNPPNPPSSFPRGCEVSGFGYNQNNLILNDNGMQAYYLIQNRSNDKIALERRVNGEAFMSPPLMATLEPMNWAAFASDVKNLNFKCYKHEGEDAFIVDCREVLDVCQYPRVRFALSNMGNYWISTNKSQHDVIQDSVAKGIYLKW